MRTGAPCFIGPTEFLQSPRRDLGLIQLYEFEHLVRERASSLLASMSGFCRPVGTLRSMVYVSVDPDTIRQRQTEGATFSSSSNRFRGGLRWRLRLSFQGLDQLELGERNGLTQSGIPIRSGRGECQAAATRRGVKSRIAPG